MVRPDFHVFAFEQRLNIVQQQLVLKDTTRKNDHIRTMSPTQFNDRITQPLRNAALKRTRDLCNIATRKTSFNHSPKQRTEIQFAGGKRKRIRFRRPRAARQMLEPHRGLPFKGDFAREA